MHFRTLQSEMNMIRSSRALGKCIQIYRFTVFFAIFFFTAIDIYSCRKNRPSASQITLPRVQKHKNKLKSVLRMYSLCMSMTDGRMNSQPFFTILVRNLKICLLTMFQSFSSYLYSTCMNINTKLKQRRYSNHMNFITSKQIRKIDTNYKPAIHAHYRHQLR